MTRSKKEQPARRGLSVHGALVANVCIEKATNAYLETAPRAVAALGGRAAIHARFQGMAVGESGNCIAVLGPVPRLTVEEWQAMAMENVEAQRIVWDTWRGVAAAGERPGPGDPSLPPVRARSFQVQR